MSSDGHPPGGDGTGEARGDALVLLQRRPLTERELRDGLLARGHAAEAIDRAVESARRARYLDDSRLALEFVLARSVRLGHGRRRLIGDLTRRGVAQEVAERAWADAVERGDLDPRAALRHQIRRRVPARAGLDERGYRRVYNALLRAGFETADIDSELAPLRPGTAETDEIDQDVSQDFSHDFPR